MSIFKKLFGIGAGATSASGPAAPREHYKGYVIEAAPYATSGQFQVAGTIHKEVDGQHRQHRFVRADRFASQAEAADVARLKARQIIDQRGDRMFD